ncbi:MAG: hypothetical protein U0736_07805 [Gemmataceae bacterium]
MSEAPRPIGTDTPARSPVRWPVYLAALALPLIAAGGWVWFHRGAGPGKPPGESRQPAVAEWEPQTEEDWQLDEAVRLLNEGGADRHRLLGPAAVFDDTPVDEAQADARQADFYLRHPKLHITAIRRGEQVRGKQVDRPRTYTLGTKVDGSTPPLRIRTETGRVEAPSRLFMINPDLVVELRDGKVFAVRPELKSD